MILFAVKLPEPDPNFPEWRTSNPADGLGASLPPYIPFFCDGSYLEFMLQSRVGWAYYPARMSRGGSSEGSGSDRVPQGSFLHYGRDKCSPGSTISAREASAFGRRDEC